jgi:hypothetical protein
MTTTNTCGATGAADGREASVGTATADGVGDDAGLARPYGVDRGALLPPQATTTVMDIAQAANAASARWVRLPITSR